MGAQWKFKKKNVPYEKYSYFNKIWRGEGGAVEEVGIGGGT